MPQQYDFLIVKQTTLNGTTLLGNHIICSHPAFELMQLFLTTSQTEQLGTGFLLSAT